MRVVASVVFLAALTAWAAAQEIPSNSFRAPFTNYDQAFGNRKIDNWNIGGSTVINENFMRLTPDRASKRGFAWNYVAVNVNHFTSTVYFRVSGQGQTLFGDGFAVWFTTSPRYQGGSLHGFTDTFKGIGVIFDTFRNTESGHYHKDVAVVYNDGSGPLKLDSGVEPAGCDGDFRYHEKRDDFNVHSRSSATITFNNGVLSIKLDAKGSGNYVDCVTNYNIPIPGDWYNNAYLGLTASTGQLADNHDILALVTSGGDESAPETVSIAVPDVSSGSDDIDAAIKVAMSRAHVASTDNMQKFRHEIEHDIAAIEDKIQNTIKKMQQKEQENLERIEELERRLKESLSNHVTDTLATRLNALEAKIHQGVQTTLSRELPALGERVKTEVGEQSTGSGWIVPFVILLLIVLAVTGFGFSKYREFKKSHLL